MNAPESVDRIIGAIAQGNRRRLAERRRVAVLESLEDRSLLSQLHPVRLVEMQSPAQALVYAARAQHIDTLQNGHHALQNGHHALQSGHHHNHQGVHPGLMKNRLLNGHHKSNPRHANPATGGPVPVQVVNPPSSPVYTVDARTRFATNQSSFTVPQGTVLVIEYVNLANDGGQTLGRTVTLVAT